MNTKQIKKHYSPRYCIIKGVHVFFVARTNDSVISLIALAAALAMHGIPWLCASIAGVKKLEAALGTGKVMKLPKNAFGHQSKRLRHLMQRARDGHAVLLIDAEVDPLFQFDDLDEALDVKRRETLTVIYSLAAHDLSNHCLHPAWCGQPDYCIAHAIGIPDDETAAADEHGGIHVPVWHSGLITPEMSDVLARRGHYRGIQPMPEVLYTYGPVPYCSLFNHDRNIDAVIQMLGQANDHIWKHVISHIADEIA